MLRSSKSNQADFNQITSEENLFTTDTETFANLIMNTLDQRLQDLDLRDQLIFIQDIIEDHIRILAKKITNDLREKIISTIPFSKMISFKEFLILAKCTQNIEEAHKLIGIRTERINHTLAVFGLSFNDLLHPEANIHKFIAIYNANKPNYGHNFININLHDLQKNIRPEEIYEYDTMIDLILQSETLRELEIKTQLPRHRLKEKIACEFTHFLITEHTEHAKELDPKLFHFQKLKVACFKVCLAKLKLSIQENLEISANHILDKLKDINQTEDQDKLRQGLSLKDFITLTMHFQNANVFSQHIKEVNGVEEILSYFDVTFSELAELSPHTIDKFYNFFKQYGQNFGEKFFTIPVNELIMKLSTKSLQEANDNTFQIIDLMATQNSFNKIATTLKIKHTVLKRRINSKLLPLRHTIQYASYFRDFDPNDYTFAELKDICIKISRDQSKAISQPESTDLVSASTTIIAEGNAQAIAQLSENNAKRSQDNILLNSGIQGKRPKVFHDINDLEESIYTNSFFTSQASERSKRALEIGVLEDNTHKKTRQNIMASISIEEINTIQKIKALSTQELEFLSNGILENCLKKITHKNYSTKVIRQLTIKEFLILIRKFQYTQPMAQALSTCKESIINIIKTMQLQKVDVFNINQNLIKRLDTLKKLTGVANPLELAISECQNNQFNLKNEKDFKKLFYLITKYPELSQVSEKLGIPDYRIYGNQYNGFFNKLKKHFNCEFEIPFMRDYATIRKMCIKLKASFPQEIQNELELLGTELHDSNSLEQEIDRENITSNDELSIPSQNNIDELNDIFSSLKEFKSEDVLESHTNFVINSDTLTNITKNCIEYDPENFIEAFTNVQETQEFFGTSRFIFLNSTFNSNIVISDLIAPPLNDDLENFFADLEPIIDFNI